MRPISRLYSAASCSQAITASSSARRSTSRTFASAHRSIDSHIPLSSRRFGGFGLASNGRALLPVPHAFKRGSVSPHGVAPTGVGVLEEGRVIQQVHALHLAPGHSVSDWVIRCFVPMEATLEQMQLPLLCRIDGPSVVPRGAVAECRTYREAVRLCWALRRVRNMTRSRLAEEAGLYASHVTCYLKDDEDARALPAEKVPAFERACGNTAVSQWLAIQAHLTVVEELQAMNVGRAA